ncbi:MAG TPA: 4-(cytidine 5'-diphospho)-2-C-methyl-D-erythritol kinase [Candidatus Binatia bacterium]|jgi:4-diphosphocytidyl-2-C-methyl-D-erythritol kinase|nr:4-(cytidine 5'-diphospho)-2-C-methyl-D-erythritol kinase [Candidatus Binatia bacterium]
MRVLAPAKVNLYLRITGRRSDGYHLLDSLMVPVSLFDEITIEATGGQTHIAVTCDDAMIPSDETNLAYRAAALLCRETGTQARTSIELHKYIPAGAGLGGGSSDAAAVLKGLNTLLSLELSEDRLCTLGARLGADVPFFIPCRPARVEGIGEILTAAPPLPSRWLVIVVPPFGVSTPWAYRRFDELPPSETPPTYVANQWPSPESLVNDLERAVIPEYPQISSIKDSLLRLGAEGALMSGSGSAVFGVFQNRVAAEQAMAALTEKGKTFLVEFLAGSPEMV